MNIVNPGGNVMFKVNNRNTRTRSEICSRLTMKTTGRCQWRRSDGFIVKFEQAIAGWEIIKPIKDFFKK